MEKKTSKIYLQTQRAFPLFFFFFNPVIYFQRPPRNESASQSIQLHPITLHPVHTCRPAVYCHYNYDCQKKSTNVLIWQAGTFIINNRALCFLCERLRVLNQEVQFYSCGKYSPFWHNQAAVYIYFMLHVIVL